MPTIERFMVQAYREAIGGGIEADEPIRASSAAVAVEIADDLAGRKIGVIAYAWRGDPRNQEIGRLVVLKQIGVLPWCVAAAFEKDRETDPARRWVA